MPNKFQQSVNVMERLEAEAKRQKNQMKEAGMSGEMQPPLEAAPGRPLPPDSEPDQRDFASSGQGIEGYLRQPAQRLAKNKTFYLDLDVVTAIKESAKKMGTTESRLVNDVLRSVLRL